MEYPNMDHLIESFSPYIFVIEQNGTRLKILASWYDGSDRAKATLKEAIDSTSKVIPFVAWLRKFGLDFIGPAGATEDTFLSLKASDPPPVRSTKEWLSIDGVKGDWEARRASCKDWKLPFDKLHEDLYTLMAVRKLTLASTEEIQEFLFTVFGILPSQEITLETLKQYLQQREIDEISREDLLKMDGITSQNLNYRIAKLNHPKPCRKSGKKQWFSVAACDNWRKTHSVDSVGKVKPRRL
jgi:hypothetical protein